VQTIEQAIDTPSHSLSSLKKRLGDKKTEALIKVYLIELSEALNLKRPLTEFQIDEIAFEVLNEFYNLSMADIHVIFRRAKTGYYGEFYDSLNMPKVLKWFRDYFHRRCSLIEEINYNKDQSLKASSSDRQAIKPSFIKQLFKNHKK
jgi:hypothetical protein